MFCCNRNVILRVADARGKGREERCRWHGCRVPACLTSDYSSIRADRIERQSAGRYAWPLMDFKWFRALFKSAAARESMGDRGENLAARFLRDLGYRIIHRNFNCELGEIDIVARDGKTLVFVEVKTRSYDDPSPEDQVHVRKQQKLTRVAKAFLSRYGTPQPPARFDVVAVIWPEGRDPIIRHVPHAFEATE